MILLVDTSQCGYSSLYSTRTNGHLVPPLFLFLLLKGIALVSQSLALLFS